MKSLFIKKSKNHLHEFSVHTKLYNMFPTLITKPIKMKKKLIYLKMYKNKSLKHYLKNSTTPLSIPRLISKVKRMIKIIQSKFPLFRHNDLHIGNIIVDDNKRLRFTDFELARLNERTPKIIRSFGITNRYNPKYDLHCFLNSLRSFLLRRRLSPVCVHKHLPIGYRGKTGKYVRNFRMLF